MNTHRIVAVALVSSAVVMLVIATVFAELVPGVPQEMRLPRVGVFVVLAFAVVASGAVIVWARPMNRLGWVLGASGLVGAAEHLVGSYAAAANVGGLPAGPAAAWIFSWLETFHLGPLGTLALLLFPDGRAPSARWRPVAWMAGAAMIALAVGFALTPGPIVLIGIGNPVGRTDLVTQLRVLVSVGFALGALSAVLSGLALVLRYRRSAGIERQQIKWVAYAGVLVVSICFAVIVLWVPIATLAVVASLAAIPLPAAMAIAILRYRLYDIDVLIKGTLVYGVLSTVLVLTYALGVVAGQTLLRPLTGGSELAVAASTLLVVALFQPLRRRVQDSVDRRFYRARYDAVRTLDTFMTRLRNEVDIDSVRSDLLDAVGATIRPAHASVWLRETPR